MNRGNQVLVAILVVQIALAVVVFWPRQASVAAGEPLFPGLEADQIVRLTIHDGEGEQVQLAKGAEGWVLPEMDDYPCREGVVLELLDKIVGLKTGRMVAETRASQVRLQVSEADFAHLIEFELEDGTAHKLYLGTSPSFGAIHARAEDQDEVYLVSDLSSSDVGTRLSTWIDTLYFSVAQDQIVALSLENQNGFFEFGKSGEEWTMVGLAEDETFDTSSVTSLISRATSVRMLRPLGKEAKEEYGLQEPSAVLVLHARSEEGTQTTYMLHVGAKSGEDNSYVLKSSESPYYVRVAEFTAKDWVEKTRDGFLELPPTPEPTATPMPAE
jgi:hypothetical protein